MIITSINKPRHRSSISQQSLFKSGVTTGKAASQIHYLESSIKNLFKKSTDLKEELLNLGNSRASKSSQEYLVKLYEKEIFEFAEKLKKRDQTLVDLEEKINSFVHVGPKKTIPIEQLQDLKKQKTNDEQIDLTLERQLLFNEYTLLKEKCVYNDRLMVLLKMKMRLCHDHRDLYELQRGIECLKTGSSDVFESRKKEANCKKRIANLKYMIELEKERVKKLENYDIEEESAVLIQKTWRGYSIRKKQKEEARKKLEEYG